MIGISYTPMDDLNRAIFAAMTPILCITGTLEADGKGIRSSSIRKD